MHYLLLFLLCSPILLAQSTDQLLLFTNSNQPILTTQDHQNLIELAQQNQIELKVIDTSNGIPVEINQTPSLVFQNHKGRSFYYGRYKNLSRLTNFIRASRLAHQQTADNIKKDILVWQNEKTIITAPIKITNLTGKLPTDLNQENFKQQAKAKVAKGMEYFQQKATQNISRNTRSFYIDFHPYLSDKGILTISVEIYSQYNCVNPIYQQYEGGLVSGKWQNQEQLWQEAGKLAEQEVIRQMKQSKNGDAFQPIAHSTPIKTWEDLNLPLPSKSSSNIPKKLKELQLPKEWTVETPQNPNEPIIIFSFLPPLDNYIGEAKILAGSLILDDNRTLKEAKGDFKVKISDITMGADDFDDAVQNKMLKMDLFPQSSFIFEDLKGSERPLQVGQTENIIVKGKFTLLGIPIDLEIPATIEPIVNDQEEPRLEVQTTFQFPLYEKFKIEGPDGPSPAKDNLQFYMKFLLKPLYKK